MNIFKRYFLFKALDSASKENAQNNITMAGFLNDHISLKIIIDGWFEKRELNALKSFFSQSDFSKALCLDIGANIGNHSLFFSTIFKEVIAFEPYDKAFDLLKINSSQVDNIQVNNFGFSDASKELPAQIVFGNIGATSIVSSPEQSNTILKVETLDSFANENSLERISFIKIDVEGHELNVLKGFQNTIKKNQCILQIEIFKKNFEDVNNFLISLGYQNFYEVKNRSNYFYKNFI